MRVPTNTVYNELQINNAIVFIKKNIKVIKSYQQLGKVLTGDRKEPKSRIRDLLKYLCESKNLKIKMYHSPIFMYQGDVLERCAKKGYVVENGKLQHREVYKTKKGFVNPRNIIHHIDFNKTNNEIDNLMEMPQELHKHIHAFMKATNIILTRQQILSYMSLLVKWN